MSITVGDLLSLPSLREAKLLAGEGGLSRIVSCVSVLEYAEPSYLKDSLFNNSEFYGSEIVITAFANIKNNPAAQCANVRRLAEVGEAGLILYYVGVFMPDVDGQLIALADELSFPLICMPKNRLDYRYSEVICDVMKAIYKAQESEESLLTELLERISKLPNHQQTIDTVLKMLSDRIGASVILTDASSSLLNIAAWPRIMAVGIAEAVESLSELPTEGENPSGLEGFPGYMLYCYRIKSDLSSTMNLMILKDGTELAAHLIRQSVDLVQLAVSIWGQGHASVTVTELVRAIMQDEPIKMRRLAEIFHVDIAAINTMWILHSDKDACRAQFPSEAARIKDASSTYSPTVITDSYEGDLVVLTDGPHSLAESEALQLSLLSHFPNPEVTLTKCGNLKDTTDTRNAFFMNQGFLSHAKKIFPRRSYYNLSEIEFARSCHEELSQGEAQLSQGLSCLDVLREAKDGELLLDTLGVYLLDCQSSVTQTSKAMFLHKNTIKYRLGRLSDLLGFRIGHMPESAQIYRALAILRLLS